MPVYKLADSSTIEVVGRGTWLDKVAKRILEREQKLGRSLHLINVESGLGASGIPHGSCVRAPRDEEAA